LHKNKIRTAVFISPIFPYITNWKTIIVRTKRFVNEYWIENLNLRQPYKKVILAYIQKKYPQHYKEYLKIYDKQNYSYWKKMNREIKSYCKQNKIKLIDYFYHEKIKKN
jgi:DNA repair photolyase